MKKLILLGIIISILISSFVSAEIIEISRWDSGVEANQSFSSLSFMFDLNTSIGQIDVGTEIILSLKVNVQGTGATSPIDLYVTDTGHNLLRPISLIQTIPILEGWQNITFTLNETLPDGTIFAPVIHKAGTGTNRLRFSVDDNNGNTRSQTNESTDTNYPWTWTVYPEDAWYILWYNSPSPSDNLTLNWISPLNGTKHNGTATFQYTLDDAGQTYANLNCSLYENGVVNTTQIISSNATNTITLNYTNIVEEDYDYYISCQNPNENTTSDTRTIIVYLDTTIPTISVNPGFNMSAWYYGQNLTQQFNFSDAHLFQYAFYIDGTSVMSATNIVSSNVSVTLNRNINGLSIGRHSLVVNVSDGHTAQYIPEWKQSYNILTKSITFDRGGDDWVKITPRNTIDYLSEFEAIKEFDRYIFKYERSALEKFVHGNTITKRITSSKPIYISERKGYAGWLVIPELNIWYDEETDTKYDSIEVEQIDQYTVDITIYGVEDDIIISKSIGELNTITETYFFYVGNYTMTYENPLLEASNTEYTINFTFDSNYMTSIDANLNWNGTLLTATKTQTSNNSYFAKTVTLPQVNSTQNISFYWNYTVYGNLTLNGNTSSFIQTINNFGIDNCSSLSAVSINFTLIHETNQTPLTGDIEIDAVVHFETGDVLIPFDFNNIQTASLCISPPEANLTLSAYMKYQTDGGFVERYYLENASLSNTTNHITLYNFDTTTGISTVDLTVKDSSYTVEPDVLVKMQRYFLLDQAWKTVQIDKSDQFGNTVFRVIKESEDYRFIFSIDGDVIQTSDSMKFVCEDPCTATFILVDEASSIINSDGLGSSITLNNDTGIITFMFDDTTGLTSDVQFKVVNVQPRGDVTICDTTISSSSGTATCNITGYTGVILATGKRTTLGERVTFIAFSTDIFGVGIYELLGADSVIFAFLIFLACAMAGLYAGGAGVIVSGILGLVVVYLLGMTSFVNFTFIGIAIIIGMIISAVFRR